MATTKKPAAPMAPMGHSGMGKGKGHMGPPAMDKAERGARAEAAEMRMQKANTKAYDAATGYKNGGMVKMTPKSTPYACGGKVK